MHLLACATVAKAKGFSGVVTDGTCRDIHEIQRISLPFFAKGKCARSGTKDKIGTIREKIQCGGINVNPGEIIFADIDGVVSLNKEEAIIAIDKAEAIQAKEHKALEKILEGARFNEIFNIEEHMGNLKSGISSKLRITL